MKQFLIALILITGIQQSFGNTPKAVRFKSYGQWPTANGQLYSDHPSSVIGHRLPAINRSAFYKAMQGSSKELVDSQLVILEKEKGTEAFVGALLMKKAGLSGGAGKKLQLFKEGHRKLDSAISKDPDDAEYRFLRLMIQENAPSFLGYHDEISADSEIIRKSYKTLPEEVQQAISDYSKKSKVLKPDLS